MRPCSVGHTRRNKRGDCMDCARVRAMAAYNADPVSHQARARAWKSANQKRVKECRAAYAPRAVVLDAEWKRNNPEKAKTIRVKSEAKRRSLTKESDWNAADIAELLKAQNGRCAECRRKFSSSLPHTIDHIHPLARGGRNVKKNLQLLCRSCNSRKNAHDPIDYARMAGRLL